MASTTEHPRSPSSQPTRRTLLAGAAAIPALALPAIAAAAEQAPGPHPDAALIALGRRIAAADACFFDDTSDEGSARRYAARYGCRPALPDARPAAIRGGHVTKHLLGPSLVGGLPFPTHLAGRPALG